MKNKLFHATFYLTLSSAIFMISGYVINIWIGRYLGPASYGTYGVIMAIVSFINITQSAGITQAVSKYVSVNQDDPYPVLLTGLKLQIFYILALVSIFIICANYISNILNDPSLSPYLKFASLIFPGYGLYALYSDYYNGLHKFKQQALMNILYSLFKLLLIIFFIQFLNLYGVLLGFILSPILSLLPVFFLPFKSIKFFPYKKIILFSLPFLSFTLISNLLQTVDLFLVKSLISNDKLVGYYTAAQNISKIPYYGITAFSIVLFPIISKHVEQGLKHETKKIIESSLRLILGILVPLTLLISSTSYHLVSFIYTREYIMASEPLAILVIGIGFFTFFSFLTYILSGANHSKIPLIVSSISIIITLFIGLSLVPKYGLIGASIATSIGSVIAAFMISFFTYKIFGVFINIRSIVNIVLSGIAIYILSKILIIPLVLLPLLYLFLSLVYILFLFLLHEITTEEIFLIKSFLPWQNVTKNKK